MDIVPPHKDSNDQRRTVFILLGIGLVIACMAVAIYFMYLKPTLENANKDKIPTVNSANANRSTNANVSAAANINSNPSTNVATNASANANQAVNSTSGVQPSLVNAQAYLNKTCTADADCGVFPCVDGTCLVQECTCSCKCITGTCGGSTSAAPGYCVPSSATNPT